MRNLAVGLIFLSCCAAAQVMQQSAVIGNVTSGSGSGSGTAPAYVQSTYCQATASVTSYSCSFTTTPSAGDLIFVTAASNTPFGSNAWNNASDNQAGGGNTYTRFSPSIGSYNQNFAAIAGSSTGTFTVTVSQASASYLRLLIAEYSNTSLTTDGSNSADFENNPSSVPCGSATTTSANDLLIVSLSLGGGQSVNGNTYEPTMVGTGGFTIRYPLLGAGYSTWLLGLADRVVPVGTYTPIWGVSPNYNITGEQDCYQIAFK
jgi:hypothetical protein